MADQAITALPKKTYSGSSQIASTDYLLGIDSAEGYQMLIQDLGEYIINRVTASLAGSTQTLASAISALNSNTTPQTKTVSYTAGENINVRALTCVKLGKLVELNFYFDATEQITNNAHIVDITDGLPKPIGSYATGAARAVNGSFTLVSLERVHNTYLQSWGTTPVGTYYYAKLLYITDEE